MNDEVKQKVSELLNEASKLLVNADAQTTASTNQRHSDATARTCGSSSASSSSSSSSSLGQTLQRAQSMLQASSSSGFLDG
jgi:uncharacterized protein YbaP (TraB family)